MQIFGYAGTVAAVVMAIAWIANSTNSASARQPEIQPKLFIIFILGAAFCEALGLIAFVLALIR